MPRMNAAGRSIGAVVKDVLLTVAGGVGILSIIWLVAASYFGMSIVILLTGSMAPGLPTGSAVVVEADVAATALRVGDIVTVPRPGYELPVTHRIVAIETIAGETSTRSLTLQGDANATADRAPYRVHTVSRALIGVPYVGFVIRTIQTPLFLGAATVLVALALVWAFWPTRTRRSAAGGRRHGIRFDQQRRR